MENIDFGSTEVIDRILQLYPNLNLPDLINQFLKDEKNKNLEFVEEDGIDDTYGYMVYMTDKNARINAVYASFADKFITLDNSCNVDLNFTWINLLYNKLTKISQHEANDYLISVSETIDLLEENNVNKKDIKFAREKLQAVAAGMYTKEKPTMTEAEKIIFMQENCD